MGNTRIISQAFFINLPDLTKKSLISDQMSELEKARVYRDILRPIIHNPKKEGKIRWHP